MGSAGPREFFSRRVVLLVWLPIAVIGALHYGTGSEHHWAHDILRRLYYLPIVLAAFLLGLRGGLIAAAVVSVSYLPHAFLHPVHHDPAHGLEKALELVLYHVVGGVAGYLAGLERRGREELQRAVDEQQRLTKQLVRAGRLSALGEVVAGMAHEIKNPLHALAGTAEVVDHLIPRDAEERRLWELHMAEIERLRRVADRFLSFSSPTPLKTGAIDLREVAERLFSLVGADARQKAVTLEKQLPDEPVRVSGDRDQLAQVGMNIVVNGFKAMGGGGNMRISVGSELYEGKPHRFLRIENDGPSIPDELLEHIFDPFASGDETGTGLGLSISSRIVHQHGGFLDVANTGLGVTFTVFLPPLRSGNGAPAL
ncbi:MAG: ATP-binding protein [bacterium]